jgi:16S rRNA (cytosine1402-N4)-methyltransferase
VGFSAADWLNSADADAISRVLHDFGEERFARKIAAAIVHDRIDTPFTTTGQLSGLISRVIPFKEKGKNPATRSFQAIRILVNSELEQVEQALENAKHLLKKDGILAVISFHSLEDRIVKNFFREQSGNNANVSRYLPQNTVTDSIALTDVSKAITPSEQELSVNPRSRSAKLRRAVKTNNEPERNA